MHLANKDVKLRKNPKHDLEEIAIEPTGGGKRYTLNLKMIGEGTFTEAYITDDNNVILLTMGEETKQMLADIYDEYGELSYIPKVEYLGQAFTNGYEMEAYKSPLYRVPLSWTKNTAKAFHMYAMLDSIIDKEWRKIDEPDEWTEDTTSVYSQRLRHSVYNALKKSKDMKPTKIGVSDSDLTKEEWNEFALAVMFLIQKSFEYSFFWIMDVTFNNVGTDANGQLILLDIFYDKLAQIEGLGRY